MSLATTPYGISVVGGVGTLVGGSAAPAYALVDTVSPVTAEHVWQIATTLDDSHVRSKDTFERLTNDVSRRDRRLFARKHGIDTASPARWSHAQRMQACSDFHVSPVLGVGGSKHVKLVFGLDVEPGQGDDGGDDLFAAAVEAPEVELEAHADTDDDEDADLPEGVFVKANLNPHFVVSRATKTLLRVVEKLSAKRPINVALTGATGCGKTSLPEYYAARTHRPFFIFDTPSIREPQEAFGFKTLEPDGIGGTRIRMQLSGLMQAIQTPRACIVIDEATRAHGSILNGLLALLDHRKRVWIDALQTHVEVADGVVFFVTANLGSQYTGTWKWDLAFENRMDFRIEVTYLEEAAESELLVRTHGIEEKTAKSLVQIANIVRKSVSDPKAPLPHAISTRQLLVAAEAIAAGLSPVEALEGTVVNTYPADGGTTSPRANVLQIIQGKLAA